MKAINITEKLHFEEKPHLKINDTILTVNNEAAAVLEIIAKMSDSEKIKTQDIISVCNAIFDESERKKLNALHLSLTDYMTVIQSAIELIVGDSSGETLTPATI